MNLFKTNKNGSGASINLPSYYKPGLDGISIMDLIASLFGYGKPSYVLI